MRSQTLVPTGPTILAQAPCRADLAGGTIDLWPLYLFHPGALKPVVDRKFPLSETRAAHEYMEKSQMFGKIVLNP